MTKRAGALKVGDIVSHDPAYGTRAVVLFKGSSVLRGNVSLGFRNVYEGCSYMRSDIDGMRMFEIETD
jgi:hypothetical protein